MKRIFKAILCAAAVVMAAVSCQKSAEPVQPAEKGKETIDICVNGLMGEYAQQDGEAVKSSLVNTVRVAWAAGDVVYVFDGTNYLGKLTAALDKKADGQTDEDRYAKLSGTISAPAATHCTLSLIHSSLMTEPAAGAEVSELSIDMSAQSSAKVPFVAYAALDYTGTTITNVVVPFQFATSVIKVNCTGLKASTAITSATLTNVNTACKLTLSKNAAPIVSGDANGTITRTGDAYFAAGKVNAEGEAVFQIAVPTLEEASQARVLTVAQDSDKVEDKNFSMKGIDPATSVNTVCQLVKALPTGALPGVFTVSNDEGATTKQIYFSQGNLYYDGSKFNFEANQYGFNSSYQSTYVSHFYWSKNASVACAESHSESGTTGNDVFFTNETVTTAKAGFTVNVNGKEQSGWRTLSTAEWQYLFNTRTFNNGANTGDGYSYQRATINSDATSVYGVILYPDNYTLQTGATSYTSTEWTTMEENGCVFLPAAGRRDGSYVYYVGVNGYYWSSTALGELFAYYVNFDSYGVYPDRNYFRDGGFSVRLITESN